MSDYELSPQDKTVLQMTKEGLTRENVVTGERESISQSQNNNYEYRKQDELEEVYSYRRMQEDEEPEEEDKQDSIYKPGSYSNVYQESPSEHLQDIVSQYQESLIEKELYRAKQYEKNWSKMTFGRESAESKKFSRDSFEKDSQKFERDSSDRKDEKFKRGSSGEEKEYYFSNSKGEKFKRSSANEEKVYYENKSERQLQKLERYDKKIADADKKVERLNENLRTSAKGKARFSELERKPLRESRLKFDSAGGKRLRFEASSENNQNGLPPVNTKLASKRLWNTWSEIRRKQRDFIHAEMATDIRSGTRYARLIHSKWKRSTGTINQYTNPQARLKRAEDKARDLRFKRDEYEYKNLSPQQKKEQRQLRKKMVKKQYQKVAIRKNMKQNQERILEHRNFIVKAKDSVMQVVRAMKTTISLVGAGITIVMLLALFILGGGFFMALCIGYGGDAMIESTYQADYNQISDCSAYMRKLETDLEEKIGLIEAENPDCDDYVYNLGEIGHNSIELMSYLAAKFVEFNLSICQSEIEAVFEEMYTLTVEIIEEPRTRQKRDEDGNVIFDENGNPVMEPYMAKICYVTLDVRPLNDIINERLNEEQKKYYDTYMLSSGGQQVYANCLPDVEWGNLISSKFGERIHPITNERTFHNGIDIAVPTGTPLYSSAAGTVTISAYSESAGNYIVVTMESGWSIKYMHLDSRSVSVGEQVVKGQFLGETGNTGRSTGPHLHLEIRTPEPENKPVDPTFMIPSSSVILTD